MSEVRKPRVEILPGMRFGRWTVVGFSQRRGQHYLYNCLCECGGNGIIYRQHLLSGRSPGCRGCSGRSKKEVANIDETLVEIDKSEYEKDDLYCIRCGPYIKLGRSAEVKKRIASIVTGNPFEVEILWVRPYKGSTEKYWHATLKGMGLHHQGEWFKEPDDMGMFFK